MRSAPSLAFIAAWGVLALTAGAGAAAAEPSRTITVEGTGAIAARPDTALVLVGVETTAAAPDVALADNTRAAKVLFAVFESFEIADADIHTAALQVAPIYPQPRSEGGGGEAKPQAFRVLNRVAARLRDLARLGEFLAEVVKAGANRLDGVAFEIGDEAPLRERARRAAIADARARAEVYAAAAEVKLGRALSIAETEDPGPRPLSTMAMRAEAVPTAPGEQTVSASVRVVYAIE